MVLAALFVWTLVSFEGLQQSRELVIALPWILSMGASISLAIDAFTLLLIGMVVWFVLAIQLVPGAMSSRDIILSQLLQVGLFGLLMSRDVVLFLSSWGIVSLVIGLLLGTTNIILQRRLGFIGVCAAALTMTVMVVCYHFVREQTGFFSTDIARFADLVLFPQTEEILFALFWVSVLASLALFPFHQWIVAAERELSPARRVLVFLSLGVMGGGALVRFAVNLFSVGARDLATAVVVIALASILYGGVRAARAGLLSTLFIGFQGFVLAFFFIVNNDKVVQAFLLLMSVTIGICGIALWVSFTRGEGDGCRESKYLLFVFCFVLVGLPTVGVIDELIIPLLVDSILLAVLVAAGVLVLVIRLFMLWRQLGRDPRQRAWSTRARWVLLLSSFFGLGLNFASSTLEVFLTESVEFFAIKGNEDGSE